MLDLSSEGGAGGGPWLSPDAVPLVLTFLADVAANEPAMKDYLGSPAGSVFWPALLRTLCAGSAATSQLLAGARPPGGAGGGGAGEMSAEQRGAVETAAVEFFGRVVVCHARNQRRFALVLCDVIRSHTRVSHGTPHALGGFIVQFI